MEHTRKLQESDVEKIVRKAKFNVKNFQISNPELDRCYEKNYGNLTARLTLNDVNLEIEDLGSMHILKVIDNSGIVRGTYDGRNPGCGGMNFSSAELSLHELNNQIKKRYETEERERKLNDERESNRQLKSLLSKLQD